MRANQNPVPLTSKKIRKTNCCHYCNGLNKYIYIHTNTQCRFGWWAKWVRSLFVEHLRYPFTNLYAIDSIPIYHIYQCHSIYLHARTHTYISNITVCVCIRMCVCLCNLMLLHLASTTNVSLGFDERFIWIVVYSYRYILIKIHMLARTKGVVLKWQYTIFLDSHIATHKPPHTHIHMCVCVLVRFGGKLHLKKVHIRKQNILALLSLSP